MSPEHFLNELIDDIEDIQSDVEFDLGYDSVPGTKLNQLKKKIEKFSDEV